MIVAGLRVKEIDEFLCPTVWKPQVCNHKATLHSLRELFLLIPLLSVSPIYFYLWMKLRSLSTIQRYQSWVLRAFTINAYFWVLWISYSIAYGVPLFILLIIASIFVDIYSFINVYYLQQNGGYLDFNEIRKIASTEKDDVQSIGAEIDNEMSL